MSKNVFCYAERKGQLLKGGHNMRCAADFRAEARAALKGCWGLAIGIGFLAMVLGGFTSMGLPEITLRFEGGDLQIAFEALGQTLHPLDMIAGGTLLVGLGVIIVLGWLVRMLIGMIVTVGYMKFNMDLIDGEIGGVEMLFRYFRQWRTMLAAGLLQAVYIIGWTLLFIIPGIIAGYRYSMTSCILAENPEMGANDAITRSKELMKGNKWRLFCMEISFIGWMILSVFTCGIGDLWLTPYRAAAHAAFYRELVPLEKGEETEEMQETQTEEDVISEE